MSGGLLKILALISMLIDHISAMFQLSGSDIVDWEILGFARSIGRFALPIFAFSLVVGYTKTRNIKKYIGRMHLFALISQVPFTLAFLYRDIAIGLSTNGMYSIFYDIKSLIFVIPIIFIYWYFISDRRYDNSIIWVTLAYIATPIYINNGTDLFIMNDLNIFYEFGVVLISISLLNKLYQYKKYSTLENILLAIGMILSIYYVGAKANYSYSAIALILILYLVKDYRIIQSLFITVWGYVHYSWNMWGVLFVFIAAILIYFYNNKRGPRLKYTFYLFYPIHLTIIALINIFILFNLN